MIDERRRIQRQGQGAAGDGAGGGWFLLHIHAPGEEAASALFCTKFGKGGRAAVLLLLCIHGTHLERYCASPALILLLNRSAQLIFAYCSVCLQGRYRWSSKAALNTTDLVGGWADKALRLLLLPMYVFIPVSNSLSRLNYVAAT